MITSVHNPQIKEALKLWNRKKREETQTCLIEGYREILRATENNIVILKLFICPELFLGSNNETLISQAKAAEVLTCSKAVFEKLSYRDRPDGLIAIAKQVDCKLEDLELSNHPLYLVAEHLEKPGNLGTILRSSDAVNLDAVLIADRCTDRYNPNVIRASVGTLFSRPVIQDSSENIVSFLKEKKIQIVAITPEATTQWTDVDLTKPSALVVGSEQYGLSDFFKCHADIQVSLPMKGDADSLNVAMAATIMMYEAIRQRDHHLLRR